MKIHPRIITAIFISMASVTATAGTKKKALPPAPIPQPAAVPDISPIDEAFNCVFQIKTATDADAPKSSYGSGFVIDKSGILATNYHVVSDALQKPKHYKVFLVDDGVNTEAQVIRFSAIDDIAIIRVNKKFPCVLKFAKTKPTVGQKINSIGLPEDLNKSIIEGTYNGHDAAGPFSQIQMSSPLNPGMSGGPTINKNGEVIGLNVAILSDAQSLAFAVPLNRLQQLLLQPEGLYPENKGKDTFQPAMQGQMNLAQAKLMSDFDLPVKSQHKIGHWTLPTFPSYYKCWRTSEQDPKERTSSVSEACFLSQMVHLGNHSRTTYVRAHWNALENHKLSPKQFYYFVHSIARTIASYINGENSEGSEESTYAGGTCQSTRILNKHNLLFTGKFCLSAFKNFDGLMEARIIATSIDTPAHSVTFGLEISGFNLDNIKKLIVTQLDGIERKS